MRMKSLKPLTLYLKSPPAIAMRVTPILEKGFFGRSLDEFKRLSRIALTAEGTRLPTAPYTLTTFHDPSSPKSCKIISDASVGGFSRAHLDWQPPSPATPHGHVLFHGHISTALPPPSPTSPQRTGYAAFRTHSRPPTIFGKSLWDIDAYTYLALRIKSDGRKYFINIQTESIVPTDLHQHRLYARRVGEWETVLVRWSEFVRTNHGVVVEPQSEMLRRKVRTWGVGLIDLVEGGFALGVERVWATNGLEGEEGGDREDEDGDGDGRLKGGQGERISWGKEVHGVPKR